jgi:hypothetical protein
LEGRVTRVWVEAIISMYLETLNGKRKRNEGNNMKLRFQALGPKSYKYEPHLSSFRYRETVYTMVRK